MDLTKVVRLTNITDEDFTHLYGGVPFTFKARESQLLPYDAARHFAKHLARKILMADKEKKRALLGYHPTDIRNDVPLYSITDEGEMIAKILGEVSSAPVSPQLTPEEVLRARIKELNPPSDAPEKGTKKDVIQELEKMGIVVDKRKSLATLQKELDDKKKELELKSEGLA